MLIYFMSVSWPYEKNKMFLFESVFFKLLLQIILAYFIISLFIPYLLNNNRKILFFVSCLALIYIIFILYGVHKSYVLMPSYPEEFSYRPPFILGDRFTHFPAYIGSIPGYLFPTIILVIFNYYKNQKETATLLEQKRTSELNALKNQLNPHFLFNTLNNLYALTLEKSDIAPSVVLKLSDIMQYVLYEVKEPSIALSTEIKYIQNYLDLEEMRHGENIKVKLSIQGDISGIMLSPLLFLPFIENSFKHGRKGNDKLKVKIGFKIVENKKLIFTTENNFVKVSKTEKHGIGNPNVARRLQLLYKDSYKLKSKVDQNIYKVKMTIPLN